MVYEYQLYMLGCAAGMLLNLGICVMLGVKMFNGTVKVCLIILWYSCSNLKTVRFIQVLP